MVNKIKNNTISEIDAKKNLNALKEIKNVETIKYKKRTPRHIKLIHLFDLLDTILTGKILNSESQENENENEKVESKKEENEKVESRKEKNKDEEYENEYNDYKNEYEYDDYKNEYEDENETMSQNKKNEIIKNLKDDFGKIIDKSKSFQEKIKLLKEKRFKRPYKDFSDKNLKFKNFKIELVDMSNEIDEKLFKTIFRNTLIKLAE